MNGHLSGLLAGISVPLGNGYFTLTARMACMAHAAGRIKCVRIQRVLNSTTANNPARVRP
jgi:ABC-type cobalamin transport system ATPase subunit